MKRIVVIFLAAAALLCGCEGDTGTQSQEPMPAASSEIQGDVQSGEEGPVQSQSGGRKEPGGQETPDGSGAAPDDAQPQDDEEEPEQTVQIAQAMLAVLDGQGDMNYARLIDMDGDGQEELLLGTNGLDCWAWRWTQEGLSQITLGSPIDRGNDGQMGGVTDQVSLVQAPDGTYGVLCQGSTDLEFYTYRFLDRTECYENRIYYEWISSPEFDGEAPDPEDYYYRNGEAISMEEFEQGIARYVVEEPISKPFDNSPWKGHVEETREALEELAA